MKRFLHTNFHEGNTGYGNRSAIPGSWYGALLAIIVLLALCGPAAAAVPEAAFTAETPTGNYPAFLVKFNDTSENIPTSWEWTFTNVRGNNTPVVFSTIRNPYVIFTANGNYSVRLECSNADGTDTTAPVFFNISDCTGGTTCNRRFYPLADGSLRNTTPGTWAGMRNAAAGTGRWEGANYNPVQIAASTTAGRYSNMYKMMLATFDTSILPYYVNISSVNVSYRGYWKNNGLGSPNISLIDANPSNPVSFAVGDWSRTSHHRQASDITYRNWAATGKNTFLRVNTSYINKTGITVFGLAFNWTADNREPAWASGLAANIFVCSGTADADSACYGRPPALEIRYNSTHVVSPPVARYSVIHPDGFFPDFRLTLTDTSTNASTRWVWIATNVSGNNTPLVFARTAVAHITLGPGNWSIRHTAGNADGSSTTGPRFFNISECSGITCSHRFYPSNYATIGNDTNGTWRVKYAATTANSLWDPGMLWYLPVTMPSLHPQGRYGHWTRPLLTFRTASLRDTVPVTAATVTMWGAAKANSFATPNAVIVDARPSDPGHYTAGDWNKTTFRRLAPDVTYAAFNVTPGKVNFRLNNNAYINRTGYTSFYFTNHFIAGNTEPSPWVNDAFAYLYYCDANAADPQACKGLFNALEVTYPSNIVPVVTGVSPATGIRGRLSAVTTISGRNFGAGTKVFLNRTGYPRIAATNVTVVSPTTIRCTFPLPADAPLGYRNVDVVNAYGRFGTRVNAYMVRAPAAPVVTSLQPASGRRGSLVTITSLSGTGFVGTPTPRVQLLRANAAITATNVTVVSATRIRCTFPVPAGAAIGAWNASVRNGDLQTGMRAAAFTVTA